MKKEVFLQFSMLIIVVRNLFIVILIKQTMNNDIYSLNGVTTSGSIVFKTDRIQFSPHFATSSYESTFISTITCTNTPQLCLTFD